MSQPVFDRRLSVECIVGDALSGRTAHLVARVLELARSGRRVTFVCARRDEAASICRRLGDAMALHGSAAEGEEALVRVTCASELALEVLDTPEAREMFGRRPRLLSCNEEAILLEDLKVSQMRNRRLRQVLTFLYAAWENLSDGTWERTPEEDLVIDRLHRSLQFTGGVLACEAANLAVKALRAHDDVRARLSCEWVFVDDYELLNRASQHLVRALALNGLAVSCANRPGLAGDDAYPCYDGVAELVRDFPDVRVSRLSDGGHSAQVRGVLEVLSADEALASLLDGVQAGECMQDSFAGSGDEGFLTARKAPALAVLPSIEEEMLALAQMSSKALEQGKRVLVVGGNALWRRNVVGNLAHAGLPVEQATAGVLRLRDLRDARQCERARRDAIAHLVRDPDDDVAWRTLVALGDSVGRSAAVDRLRTAVAGAGEGDGPLRLHAALELLDSGEIKVDELGKPLLDDLRGAYLRAKRDLAAVQGMDDAPCEDRSEGRAACEGAGGMAGACDRAAVCAPGKGAFGDRDARITVCSPDDAGSAKADVVIFGGFVNGIVPCRAYFDPAGLAGSARLRERQACVRRVFGVASRAAERVVFTAFSSCSLQAAETMDVHIESIKLRRGLRVALTSPSIFADGLGC